MIKKIKKILCKLFVSKGKENFDIRGIKNRINPNQPTFFLLQTPVHINIGDHFISVAEIQFLENNFKNYNIIEIQEDIVDVFLEYGRKLVKPQDRILIHGGGNLGNEYLHHENLRREIIQIFSKNKIIILPQTIHFSNDEIGEKELEKSISIYAKHSDLVICAREEKSYDFAKKSFENKVLLIPDIVLQYVLPEVLINDSVKKETAIAVLRSDRESILNEENRNFIIHTLSDKYKHVFKTDMFCENKEVVINNSTIRQKLIDEKLTLFRNSNLVVTDRLHGMIVSAITGVPCIAIGNYNHKIIESFKWIKLSTNTLFIQDISDLPKAMLDLEELVKNKGECRTPQLVLNNSYKQLIEALE
ncbi:polysaccharide pyruvyl transferase family protein [Empedobacter brevis]|uniref:Polysaccharide pyruvyl transferase family protein n=1 Tax=Empedobacter brevis TaxID=247 RepID=A0AAJ1QFD6_9FLAO|nr:polysaccharide pyruvyl transferase family protein [Empedobacter brevis]MDM1073036.1 polysaccharide pyruvyl transferase family protein [Empedobacter brevis]